MFCLSVVFLFLSTGLIFAQNQTTSVADSINSQFKDVIESANNYQDYKVVKRFKLENLRKTTREEIQGLEENIVGLNKKIDQQQAQIDQIQQKLKKANTDVENATKSKEELSFLGIRTQKGTYKTIVWIVVLLLVLILIFFIYKYKQSHRITVEARDNLKANEHEFDDYRKKALEKQQRLGRQLQDERNKVAKKNTNNS